MAVFQKEITLPAYRRGFHIISEVVLPEIRLSGIQNGICTVFIKHTSAGLTINENADPSVRRDFESFINDLVPETYRKFTHTFEGDDDMPAHIKASMFGASVTFPVSGGRAALGTWQGIYLCEFRDNGGRRNIIITITGE